jgi:hypothetical protein
MDSADLTGTEMDDDDRVVQARTRHFIDTVTSEDPGIVGVLVTVFRPSGSILLSGARDGFSLPDGPERMKLHLDRSFRRGVLIGSLAGSAITAALIALAIT